MEEILYIIETVVLMLFVFYLVWLYSSKDVPNYVKLLTYLSWILTFSAVLVLPIDIANSYRQEDVEKMNSTAKFIFTTWRVLYWLNFILSWLILPYFQDFEDSGEFTKKQKMLYSIKKNLIIYGVGLTIIILLFIYIAVTSKLGFVEIEGILVGLANLFGIVLIILLLGYGLAAIPKKYIRQSNLQAMLENCYCQAVEVDESKTEKIYDLEEKCRILYILKREYSNSAFSFYLDQVINQIPDDFQEGLKASIPQNDQSRLVEDYQPLTMSKVTDLNRQVKRLLFDFKRADARFDQICDTAWGLEMAISTENVALQDNQAGSFFSRFYSKFLNLWNSSIRKYLNQYIGYFFAFLSFILILGELSIFLKGFPINIIHFMLEFDMGFYSTQFILLIPLTYIAYCTYYGLFGMKIAGLFSFNKPHQTDAPSLLFGSMQDLFYYSIFFSNFGRVSFPLCFNFIQLTKMSVDTQFKALMGNMDVIPIFGSSFSLLLPLMLILMCVCNVFNVGTKLMGAIGLGNYAAKDEKEGMSEEGKRIVQRERENKKKVGNVQVQLKERPGDKRDTNNIYAINNLNQILNI